MIEIRANPRPGLVSALLEMRIDGEPAPDLETFGNLGFVIRGGFETTTVLTAHALEWLSQHPGLRALLNTRRETPLDPAAEEFLRYFTAAPGDGQTFSEDVELMGSTSRRASGLDFVGDGKPRPVGPGPLRHPTWGHRQRWWAVSAEIFPSSRVQRDRALYSGQARRARSQRWETDR
ncbi:hypothetical protein MLAC_03100 [Mycobacterium lacus]|uniref:Cytochrome P450 n=1 Tax=Mycobacterium lacus TaxID=169765 RepID=A0A7I7NEB5_9MYCO|nr:hypothetical protein MLAC_03100 [Mycobacterium lacus]